MKMILGLWLILAASVGFTQDYFLPENNRLNPVSRNARGISEAEFNQAIKVTSDYYVPFIQKHYGKTLEINGNWKDATVNAWVKPTATGFYIQMFGGLARDSHTTLEGFYTVIFHEIGHAIGGAPKYARYGSPEWASSEQGADYFATAKAAKIIFDLDLVRTLELYDSADSEDFAKSKCDSVFTDEIRAAVCYRSALGGISLGNLLASFSNSKVSIETPSKIKVTTSNVTGYPPNQCRLDIYFQGALCDRPGDELMSETDPLAGACPKGIGGRPECAYKY